MVSLPSSEEESRWGRTFPRTSAFEDWLGGLEECVRRCLPRPVAGDFNAKSATWGSRGLTGGARPSRNERRSLDRLASVDEHRISEHAG